MKIQLINLLYKISLKLKGQSLVEITVALGALSILLTISSIAIITALNNAQESKNQNLASLYSQQGMDIIRQMRDTSWTNFNSFSGNYCMAKTCTQLTTGGVCGLRSGTSCGSNLDNFTREVNFQRDSITCRSGSTPATRVIVSVGWIDGKCPANTYCRRVNLETCFSNIYEDPSL